MLAVLGYRIARGVDGRRSCRRPFASSTPMALPAAVPEAAALAKLAGIAAGQPRAKSCIGQGYYGTHTPGVILRNILENPAWYTAYTPYQPEIAQGRLEALVNFQTMVCDLTGMAIANASMLDEAHGGGRGDDAGAAHRQEREPRASSSPTTCFRRRWTSCARARQPLGIEVVVGRGAGSRGGARGRVRRAAAISGRGRRRARLPRARRGSCTRAARSVIVAADILALTLLAPPGEWGADAVVGSTQRFGVPMGYGGPHAGYLATRDEFKRVAARPPGRRHGRRARQSPRTGSRCRRASSTSAARRRRPTSARRRCCSRSSRACTPSTTGRKA